MPGKPQESDPSANDLVIMAEDLLKGIAAEPVPQHLVALAQQLQAALEKQACKGTKGTDNSVVETSDSGRI